MHEIEIIINIWLQSMGEWLSIPMQVISFLGTQYFQMMLFAWIYWCIDHKTAIRLGMALIAGNSFNVAFKWIFHAPRPYWINTAVKPLSSESSFGIPSGHAMMSTIFYGRIALWLKEKWLTIFIVAIIFLIGLSRLYLGVHFLSDVIAGLAFGISFLIIFTRLEKPVSKWLNQINFSSRIAVFFIFSLLVIFFFSLIRYLLSSWQIPGDWLKNVETTGLADSIDPIRMKDIFTLSGLGFGMLTGYAWINKYDFFQNHDNRMQNIIRLVFGFSGLAVLLFFPVKIYEWLTPKAMKLGFIYFHYSLISFWITGAAPVIFQKFGF